MRTTPAFASICQTLLAAVLIALLAFETALAQTAAPPNDTEDEREEVVHLEVFTVEAQTDSGYGATQSIGGSRVNMAVKDVPASIITINEAVIRDLAAVDLLEAINFVSGIATAGGGQGDTQYSLRGYAQQGINYRDGLPDREWALRQSPTEAAAFDRLEVIKGPAGVLYGSGASGSAMGGIVNRVTKNPQLKPRTLVQLNASHGWDDYARAMLDTTGPIGRSGLAYRVILVDRDGERGWGGKDHRWSSVNSLAWHFGSRRQHRVWGRFSYLSTDINYGQGAVFADKDYKVPAFFRGDNRTFSSSPLDSITPLRSRNYEVGAQTAFSIFGMDWTARLIGRHGNASGGDNPSYSNGTGIYALDETGLVLGDNLQISADDPRVDDWRAPLWGRIFEGFYKQDGLFADLAAKFKIGPTKHTLLFSGELRGSSGRQSYVQWQAELPDAPPSLPNTYSVVPEHARQMLSGFTIADVINGRLPTLSNIVRNTAPFKNKYAAVGFQESMSLFDDRIILVAGGRFDKSREQSWDIDKQYWLDNAVWHNGIPTGPWRKARLVKSVDDEELTYKAGLVVAPVQGVSVFAQQATTFRPLGDTRFPNQRGKIQEFGVKTELFNRTLISTVSVFKMSLTNVVIYVVGDDGQSVQKPAGTQYTEGWEADISWQPNKAFRMLVGFSNLTSVNENKAPFRGVPQKATYSVMARYTFQDTFLKGLGAGANYKHRGRRTGEQREADPQFWLPEIDEFGVFLSYPVTRQCSVQLNVNNVFDSDKVLTAVSQSASVQQQYPRTYVLSVNYRL
jgi:outer membrane receptor protein involved in Fe transport